MSIAPVSTGLSLGVAAVAGGVGLGFGLGLGYLTAVDDGSTHHGSRNGFSHKTDARSREVALAKVEGERDFGKVATIAGGVLAGIGLLTGGYTRAALLMAGGASLGAGVGVLLQNRDAEEKVAHLPSEADLPPVQAGPWKPDVPLLQPRTQAPPPLLPSLAERIAAAGTGA